MLGTLELCESWSSFLALFWGSQCFGHEIDHATV